MANNPNPKSSNPNNPDCSTAVQAVLDIAKCLAYNPNDPDTAKAVQAASTLLHYMDTHKSDRDKMSKLIKSHEYPDKSITFCRTAHGGQYISHLSISAIAVLHAMVGIMPPNNHVMLTMQDIMDYVSSIGNRTTASKAINELICTGCIAVARKGNTRIGTVYMVNPCIASVGVRKPQLHMLYWSYTGDQYEDGVLIKSDAHTQWDIINRQTYTIANCKLKATHCKGMIADSSGKVQAVYNKFAPTADNTKPPVAGTTDGPKIDQMANIDRDINSAITSADNLPM